MRLVDFKIFNWAEDGRLAMKRPSSMCGGDWPILYFHLSGSRPGLTSGGPLRAPPIITSLLRSAARHQAPDRNRRWCRRRRATAAVLGSLAGRCCSSRSSLSTRWQYTSSPAASSSPAPSSTSTAAATSSRRRATSPQDAPPGPRPPSTALSSSSSTRWGATIWIPRNPRTKSLFFF